MVLDKARDKMPIFLTSSETALTTCYVLDTGQYIGDAQKPERREEILEFCSNLGSNARNNGTWKRTAVIFDFRRNGFNI